MCFKCKKKGHYSNECTEELPVTSEAKGNNLLINKEDSSDDEIQSNDEKLDDLQKNNTDPGGEEEDDDSYYKEDAMLSDDDYEGFTFIQDTRHVSCHMNNKARIPDSWILLWMCS